MAIFAFALTFGISCTQWGAGRYEQLSILTHNGTITGRSLNYSLAMGSGKVLEARIFNNKLVLAAREFLRQYASYFSPQFLTGEGYIQPKRYNLIEHGTTYWILLLVIGGVMVVHFWQPFNSKQLSSIFPTNRARFFLLLLWLLLVAPIPSALTLEEVPNIHRTLIMSWVWAIIFAIAAYLLVKAKLFKRYRVITVTIITVVLTVEVVYFWHAYTTLDYESNFIYRDDNKKLLANWLIQNGHNYDQIIIPNQNNLLLYYLFFKQDFSADYIGQFDLGWYIDHLDNIYPHDDVCGMAIDQKTMNATERIAVVSTEPCLVSLPLTATTIETINRKNLTHAYTIQAL